MSFKLLHVAMFGDTADRPLLDAASMLAKRFEANLLEIGAYSHSRLRELVFGDVTRHVLRGVAMPVLLVH